MLTPQDLNISATMLQTFANNENKPVFLDLGSSLTKNTVTRSNEFNKEKFLFRMDINEDKIIVRNIEKIVFQ